MSKDSKITRVYFYQIIPQVAKNELNKSNTIISKVFKFKNSTHKIFPFSDGDISISNIESKHSDRYCLGTFIYNQKNNVPPKYDGTNTEALELNLDQGLAYDSSFIFDSKTNIIALESKKPGVSLGSIIKFIHENYDVPEFDFSIVITPSEYQKFLNSPNYYRIEYDIAKPTNAVGIKSNDKSSLGSTVNLMDDINALKGSIVYSVGMTKKRSLDLKQIRQFVQSLLKLNDKDEFVTNLKVTGDDLNLENKEVFDLVSNRLFEDIEVPKRRVIGKFFTKEKYRQIEAIYLKHQTVLLKQYKI